ncbi:universal stress protein [Sphingobacteriales bacterium UPWRP_1]|nr:hypothetical protein BVG80_10300 [Sphingobacteriales bacterium TSM_CSM]PSJ72973.1 universal stress protein [Sphingobacteriales bacterium UPWRP_1]
MRKIFLPTDFSEISHNAARLAAAIARKSGSSIFLFHLLNLPVDWDRITVDKEKHFPELKALIANTKKRVEDYAQSDLFEGIKVDWEVFINDTIEHIVRHAETLQSDMIVMGTHGSSGFNELMLGSNTQKIVRYAACPVIAVHQLPVNYQLKDIALFSNFDTSENYKQLFEHALGLAKMFGAKLHLVKVLTPVDPENYEVGEIAKIAETEEVIRKDYVRIEYLRTVEEGIFDYINKHKIDMVVMGTHGRTGLMRLVMGSVAEVVVNHSPVPVMVARV